MSSYFHAPEKSLRFFWIQPSLVLHRTNFLSLCMEHVASQSSAQLSQFLLPQLRAADHISDISFRTQEQSDPVNIIATGALSGKSHTDLIHVLNYCLKTNPLPVRYNWWITKPLSKSTQLLILTKVQVFMGCYCWEKVCSTAFRILKVEETELFPFLFPTPSYKELRKLLSIKAKLLLPD